MSLLRVLSIRACAAAELFMAQSIYGTEHLLSAASFSSLRVSNPVLGADYAGDRKIWLKSVCRAERKCISTGSTEHANATGLPLQLVDERIDAA
jgi:hypothetical protein